MAEGVQSCGYLLELSLDWIVLRASENIHHLLGESHVTLIDEPLGRFVHGHALHDLRNLFSRLSGTTGICRAYAVRLTDEHEFVDIAFHVAGGRVILEAVPAARTFGEAFGTVGGLVAGLGESRGQSLLDGAARRMRALTGFDRVTVFCGKERAESARGAFSDAASGSTNLPMLVADATAEVIPIFPRVADDDAIATALLRGPDDAAVGELGAAGIRSVLRAPFSVGDMAGEFRCDSRVPKSPSFELHSAAELFAQMVALRLEMEGLRAFEGQPAK